MPLLEVTDLTVQFGQVRALDGVTCSIDSGEIVGLIGPNGAGKTTFIDAVTGFVSANGTTRLAGEDISRQAVHKRVRKGLTRTFQSMELFQDLTVQQNLMAAAENSVFRGFGKAALRAKRTEAVVGALESMGLEDVATSLPGQLPLGRQKVVAVARALASGAKVLLLDEPAAGLDSRESLEFAVHLKAATDGGAAVLLIEHDMDMVMRSCDRLLVLSFGRIIASGTPAEISANEVVRKAYLGDSTSNEEIE